jgi:hypothetical protein
MARDLKPNLTNNDIVRGLIPRDSFGEVHADSSGGKTTIILIWCSTLPAASSIAAVELSGSRLCMSRLKDTPA